MMLTNGYRRVYLLLLLCLPVTLTNAQTPQQSGEYINTIDAKLVRFNGNADNYTKHTLDDLISTEKRMQDKMAASDPVASRKLFGYAIDSLRRLKAAMSAPSATAGRLLPANYFPYSDSLRQTLAFLQKTSGAVGNAATNAADAAANTAANATALSGKLTTSLQQVNVLEGKLNTIAVIQNFIRQRQQILTGALGNLPQYAGNLQQLNKTAYYYSAQIATYKATLKDPATIERKMLDAIGPTTVFQALLQHNGQLAGLFVPRTTFTSLPLTGNPVSGLPNRGQLHEYLRQHMPTLSDTTDPVAQLQQKFTAAGTQLHEAGGTSGAGGGAIPGMSAGAGGNLLSQAASGGGALSGAATSAMALPSFTPNSQKTKTFGQRLQWGFDLQFGRAVSYLPATTNLGITVGYKLNDRLSAGIGVDYLIGMGTGWKDLHISNQGVGLRSYAKWQIKKGWNIQGGVESNYMTSFTSISQLRGLQQWQTSALLGISKQYRLSRKVSGNVQVLYDFLYQQHQPTTQPFLFRLGYNLK